MSSMENISCNICGRDDTEPLFVAPDNDYETDVRTNIVRCRECGFAYANPRLDVDEVAKHYPNQDYYSYQDTAGKESLRDRLKTAARQSTAGYDRNLSFSDRLICKTVGRLLRMQMDIVIPFRENGRILDIGCGNGEMIGWMRDYGWETYGTEISEQACEAARHRGLQAFCGQLNEAGFEEAFFDVITINHVVEHLYDPKDVVKQCHRLLKDDGLLIVDCPNFDCYDSRLFKEFWHQVDAPRHVNQFTKATLEKLLDAAGFKVERWKFKPPIPLLDKRSLFFLRRSRKGRGCGGVIVKGTLIKALSYIFNINRGPKFSWNITAYAVKRK